MTREEFVKQKFKAYQEILYTNRRTFEQVDMLLVSIDFDTEVMKLIPTCPELYEEKEYYIHIGELSIPRRSLLKVVKR